MQGVGRSHIGVCNGTVLPSEVMKGSVTFHQTSRLERKLVDKRKAAIRSATMKDWSRDMQRMFFGASDSKGQIQCFFSYN